jgi:hypothetical protein
MHTVVRTDTVRIPVIDGELADHDTTVEFRPPWLLPPVTATYGRRRLRDTAAALHLTASVRSAFWPTAIGSGLILAVTALAGGVL